jgi:serine/threonine-protein kinase
VKQAAEGPSRADIQLGTTFENRYLIERELGRGGMAVVYLARDQKHERPVAIKVLQPELCHSLQTERFLHEIKLSASLTHPHIVPVYDSGSNDGQLYYVMAYIEGESLRARLNREKRLPLEEALKVAREVADALDYAHTRGVIHRDIKPENVLLGSGHALVSDFGIARAIAEADVPDATGGHILGTPDYMSPEQISRDVELDGRTDIYSLGCLLFESLAGKPPFGGLTVRSVMLRRLVDPAPSVRSVDSSIPASVDAAVSRALETEPRDRFPSAAEFSAALQPEAIAAQPAAGTASAAPEASIAVLPFANLSSDPDTEYFSDGMTEEIINALAQVPALRVAARTSAFAFKGKSVDAREIGEKLRVRTLLEGSVRKAGDQVRVTAQLINAADGYHLWSQNYDRKLADVFAVQDELARAISSNLTRTVATPAKLVQAQTRNPEAYNLYLRGRHAWAQGTPPGFAQALDLFQQALALDPDYAQAHAWFGYAYAMLGFEEFGAMPPEQAIPLARAAALRAVELDETVADAHLTRAIVATLYDWDWDLAQREYDRGMALGSSGPCQHWYALYLCAMGHAEEAMQVIRRVQVTDPLSVAVQVSVGRCLHFARRLDEADAVLRAHIEVNPGSYQGYVALIRNSLSRGRLEEAILVEEQATKAIGRRPVLMAYAGEAHGRLGHRAEAELRLNELREMASQRYVPEIFQGIIHLGLEDYDTGYGLLEEACARRSGWCVFLQADPEWDWQREDPRFQRVVRRVGVPA